MSEKATAARFAQHPVAVDLQPPGPRLHPPPHRRRHLRRAQQLIGIGRLALDLVPRPRRRPDGVEVDQVLLHEARAAGGEGRHGAMVREEMGALKLRPQKSAPKSRAASVGEVPAQRGRGRAGAECHRLEVVQRWDIDSYSVTLAKLMKVI